MPLVLVSILLPIVAGALLAMLPRGDRVLSRAIGTRGGSDYVWDGLGGRHR